MSKTCNLLTLLRLLCVFSLCASTAAVPVIWDDDGSVDGLMGLMLLLSEPQINVKAMIISQGLAKPTEFTPLFMRFLANIGQSGIPVGIGPDFPLDGNNSFPEVFRSFSQPNFFEPFVSIPDEADDEPYSGSGEELIIQTLELSPKPITYFLSGGQTTLANVITMEPELVREKIKEIFIMGGAVLVQGNLFESPNPELHENKVAEWNIWIDPVAADIVFSSGIPIKLIPLDATNQITFSFDDMIAWNTSYRAYSKAAADFMNFALTVIGGGSPLTVNPAWDLVAAIVMVYEEFCQLVPFEIVIDVDSSAYTSQGQTVPILGSTDFNAEVCLFPNFAYLPFESYDLFSRF